MRDQARRDLQCELEANGAYIMRNPQFRLLEIRARDDDTKLVSYRDEDVHNWSPAYAHGIIIRDTKRALEKRAKA